MSNFQAVNQGNGQYVKMMAQILRAGDIKQGRFGLEAPILVNDTTGIQGEIICSPGKYQAPIPTLQDIGKTEEFSVKATTTNAGLKFYGFWNNKKAPQSTPTSPQQPAQATTPVSAPQSTPESSTDEIRRFCIELAVRELCAGKLKSETTIYKEADSICNYIKTGNPQGTFDQFAKDNPVGQDNQPY